MAHEMAQRKIVTASNAAGTLWFVGWLFTIGFAKLIWWKALLGLVIWPYYLAVAIR